MGTAPARAGLRGGRIVAFPCTTMPDVRTVGTGSISFLDLATFDVGDEVLADNEPLPKHMFRSLYGVEPDPQRRKFPQGLVLRFHPGQLVDVKAEVR